jgi:predicted esterase
MRLALVVLLFAFQDPDRAELTKEFERRRDELKGTKEADPYVKLGDWCVEKTLKDDAKWSYQKAYEFDKAHAGIRPGMIKIGYDVDNDVWRSVKDVYAKKRKQTPALDLDKRYELASYAKEVLLEKEWKKECEDILKLDPEHRAAREALGFTFHYGSWYTAAEIEVEKKVDEVFAKAIEDKKDAATALADLKAAGYKGALADVQAALKFAESPNGPHKDFKLQTDADKFNGEYTYGIPSQYKPWRKNPLIVFLHGGGDGVGDGDDYFPQIWPHSGPKGYVTVCPTVLEKVSVAWSNERHVNYVRSIVKEIRAKYNIDPDRMYLMGHSMGGFGCFYIGTRTTDLFAAISPWSGGPMGWIANNLKYTPTYIIHGNKDAQVNVAGSREADKQLTQLKYPHVYVELSVDGHGVPGPEQDKAVDWLAKQKFNPLARAKK